MSRRGPPAKNVIVNPQAIRGALAGNATAARRLGLGASHASNSTLSTSRNMLPDGTDLPHFIGARLSAQSGRNSTNDSIGRIATDHVHTQQMSGSPPNPRLVSSRSGASALNPKGKGPMVPKSSDPSQILQQAIPPGGFLPFAEGIGPSRHNQASSLSRLDEGSKIAVRKAEVGYRQAARSYCENRENVGIKHHDLSDRAKQTRALVRKDAQVKMQHYVDQLGKQQTDALFEAVNKAVLKEMQEKNLLRSIGSPPNPSPPNRSFEKPLAKSPPRPHQEGFTTRDGTSLANGNMPTALPSTHHRESTVRRPLESKHHEPKSTWDKMFRSLNI